MSQILERIADRSAKVVVLGQGYVGLVVAMRASEAGFAVVGFEPDEDRAKHLAVGDSYIEDVPDTVLQASLARGYVATSDPQDLRDFDVAVVSVPTPLQDRLPDLSFIESASSILGPFVTRDCVVILESTTFPGTTEEVMRPILEAESDLTAGKDFHLGYSPERIDPGNPIFGLHNTPKIVSGINEDSLTAVDAFFATFVETTVPASGCAEAELAKVIENTFRHVNIALVNEIAMYAHDLGIDAIDAIDLAATKPFGFMRFTPGPGVGGHCLPIDPTYLSWRVKQHLGENFRFIDLANDINEHMPRYVVRRATASLNAVKKAINGSHVVIWGAAYKPNVGDTRESPALDVVRLLLEQGARVSVVEPHATSLQLHAGAEHYFDASQLPDLSIDLSIILTDHAVFDYDLIIERSCAVLDTRNRLRDAFAVHVERL